MNTIWDASEMEVAAPDLQRPPVSGLRAVEVRSFVAALFIGGVGDLTLYRGHGYSGLAVLFVLAPWLMALGIPAPRWRKYVLVIGAMILALAARLVWCGSPLPVILGFALVVAGAMALAGHTPYVPETIGFAFQAIAAGYRALRHDARSMVQSGLPLARLGWLNVVLPALVCLLFGLLFVLANPDLFKSVWRGVDQVLAQLRDWLLTLAPGEALFWGVAIWLSLGLMRPVTKVLAADVMATLVEPLKSARSPRYSPFRNTLFVVIGLFAVYLVFEFRTLWFREFPPGFYYSGYAHNGAAWLTMALAVSTLVLSLIFRGDLLRDPRVGGLRQLAWIWSVENLVLAAAVYNRLLIYVHFNGMTRMRMVGFFGITTVIAGFGLVVYKIARERRFVWLVRAQLWTLALAFYLYAITPVDAVVTRYNVRRILAGDPAPSVQISVHPLSSEGVLCLSSLVECPDAVIREGVRALLAQKDADLEVTVRRRAALGWTAYQGADARLLDQLRARRHLWTPYTDPQRQDEALQAFHDYAYQWY